MYSDKITQSVAEAAKKVMDEELKGQQHKLDKNKNNKIDSHDFKLLRKEEQEQIDELSKDTMKSYVSGAKSDVAAHKDQKSSAMDQGDHKTASDSAAAIAKRQAGMKVAKAKMNNEETEQIQEYTSIGGKYVHRQKEVKDAETGVTDWDKEEKMSKDVAKPAAKKRAYGAHQNRRTNTKLYKEMLESFKTGGLKALSKTIAENKIEEESSQEEFKKELDDQKAKFDGKKKTADVAKPAVQAVQSEGFELPGGTSHHEVYDKDGKLHSSHGAQRERAVNTAKEIGGKAYRVHGSGYDMKRTEIKEDVEQLDELSPGTLKSYVNKAKPEVQAAKAERADARDSGDGKTANDAYQLAKKRTAGIKLAKMKLNKEETSIDEATHTEIQVYDMTDGSQKPQVNIVDLEEKSLTDAETAKKEEIVKSMKKGLQGFKDRYGDRAKSVMYATATKTAKDKA